MPQRRRTSRDRGSAASAIFRLFADVGGPGDGLPDRPGALFPRPAIYYAVTSPPRRFPPQIGSTSLPPGSFSGQEQAAAPPQASPQVSLQAAASPPTNQSAAPIQPLPNLPSLPQVPQSSAGQPQAQKAASAVAARFPVLAGALARWHESGASSEQIQYLLDRIDSAGRGGVEKRAIWQSLAWPLLKNLLLAIASSAAAYGIYDYFFGSSSGNDAAGNPSFSAGGFDWNNFDFLSQLAARQGLGSPLDSPSSEYLRAVSRGPADYQKLVRPLRYPWEQDSSEWLNNPPRLLLPRFDHLTLPASSSRSPWSMQPFVPTESSRGIGQTGGGEFRPVSGSASSFASRGNMKLLPSQEQKKMGSAVEDGDFFSIFLSGDSDGFAKSSAVRVQPPPVVRGGARPLGGGFRRATPRVGGRPVSRPVANPPKVPGSRASSTPPTQSPTSVGTAAAGAAAAAHHAHTPVPGAPTGAPPPTTPPPSPPESPPPPPSSTPPPVDPEGAGLGALGHPLTIGILSSLLQIAGIGGIQYLSQRSMMKKLEESDKQESERQRSQELDKSISPALRLTRLSRSSQPLTVSDLTSSLMSLEPLHPKLKGALMKLVSYPDIQVRFYNFNANIAFVSAIRSLNEALMANPMLSVDEDTLFQSILSAMPAPPPVQASPK